MPPKGRILVRPTTQQRREARRTLGALRTHLVSATTAWRYHTAVNRFLRYWEATGQVWPASLPNLDRALQEFIEALWQQGDSRTYATDALSGIGHYLSPARGNIGGAWRLVSAWQHLASAWATPRGARQRMGRA